MSAVAAGSERTALDRLRWPLCLLVVLVVHGVAVVRLREIKPAAVAVNAPPAVALDLAPLPAPAPPTVAPTPPTPVATEPPPPVAPPPTEPPPVATEPPPPEPAPLPPEPEQVLPDPLPPPPVPPEVALPRPVPPKRPPPIRHTTEKPSPTVTPQTTTDAPAARPAQAAPPQAAAAPGAAAATWESLVAAYLARFKRYPLTAQRRGEEGVAMVRFSVDRNGMVHAVTLARSSGHPDLDGEAQSLVDRAQPLPKPPADMPAAATDVVVPIHFSLH